MNRPFYFVLTGLLALAISLNAQPNRWQQRADYTMEARLDVQTHQFSGTQSIRYVNNSPDTLHKLFYHLYFNAFQPGSSMDVRSRNLPDPDGRVTDRIFKLSPTEEGSLTCLTLKVNGKAVKFEHNETILEVTLTSPILPGAEATLEMTFEGQVPIQIRRSGRDNSEGIAYSMSQWYPKLCEYDYNGWHPNPYIAREFYGIWGDWDVKLTLDSSYVVAATGYLQNPNEIGHGYEKAGAKVKRGNKKELTWHFLAPNVHDFVWAADPDYIHKMNVYADTLEIHYFFQPEANKTGTWDQLAEKAPRMFESIGAKYGAYAYRKYSFIQGGDGGMEYPMATLILGNRPAGSVIGTALHELIHSWFQMMLATDEALHPWMDEGFNEYAEATIRDYVFEGKYSDDPFFIKNMDGLTQSYLRLVQSGKEEPLSTHSDHYNTNFAYSVASYIKGAVYLNQLGYIIGKDNLAKGMLAYYYAWRFKHPNPSDLLRIMEKQSGLELDWYNEYFVYTTKTVDYKIQTVEAKEANTEVTLKRVGLMPMPVDLVVTYRDGSQECFYIPLELMRGEKPNDFAFKTNLLPDWPWVNPTRSLTIPRKASDIAKLEIDPTQRLADVNRADNLLELPEGFTGKLDK